jgi:hypothetical protein
MVLHIMMPRVSYFIWDISRGRKIMGRQVIHCCAWALGWMIKELRFSLQLGQEIFLSFQKMS